MSPPVLEAGRVRHMVLLDHDVHRDAVAPGTHALVAPPEPRAVHTAPATQLQGDLLTFLPAMDEATTPFPARAQRSTALPSRGRPV